MNNSPKYYFENPFGSVSIELQEQIITAQFHGSVSLDSVNYFAKISKQLIAQISDKPWGYVSYSAQADAATPEALATFIQCAVYFYQQGCVASAYVLKSPIAIAQVQQMRSELNVTEPLHHVLFDNLQQATQFVLGQL